MILFKDTTLSMPEMKALIVAINALNRSQWRDSLSDKDTAFLMKAQEKLCRAMIEKTMGPPK